MIQTWVEMQVFPITLQPCYSPAVGWRMSMRDREVVLGERSRDVAGRHYPFPVHLTADQIAESDEYAEADPYSVEEAITGPFHQRRIDLTLELIEMATLLDGPARSVDLPIRILDVGCGEGHITAKIQRACPEADIHALDYSLSAISKAHEQFPGISFSVADALRSPYPEGPFDIVVCNNLWEHVTDPLGLLEKMKSVLKPHGFIVISTPSRFRTQNLARVILGRPIRMMSKHHVTEYTVGQMYEHLAYGGFDVVKAISRPNRSGPWKARLARKLFSAWRRLTGSHHELEATIFYLARSK